MLQCLYMELTEFEVKKIATLARLSLSDEEVKEYAVQLTAIFGYIEMLNEVDTEGVEETCQVTGLEDVFRNDVSSDSDEEMKKKLVSSFPETKSGLLKVKGVFVDE